MRQHLLGLGAVLVGLGLSTALGYATGAPQRVVEDVTSYETEAQPLAPSAPLPPRTGEALDLPSEARAREEAQPLVPPVWPEEELLSAAWDAAPEFLHAEVDCAALPCRVIGVATGARSEDATTRVESALRAQFDPAFVTTDTTPLFTDGQLVTVYVVAVHDQPLNADQQRAVDQTADWFSFRLHHRLPTLIGEAEDAP